MQEDLRGRVALVFGSGRPVATKVSASLLSAGASVHLADRTPSPYLSNDSVGRCRSFPIGNKPSQDLDALLAVASEEKGRIDFIFVEVWSGYDGFVDLGSGGTVVAGASWRSAFIEELTYFSRIIRAAVPIMSSTGGTIVGAASWAFGSFTPALTSDLEKAAALETFLLSTDAVLRDCIASIILAPGPVPAGRFSVGERGILETHDWARSLAQLVPALMADTDVLAKSGRLLTLPELVAEYGGR